MNVRFLHHAMMLAWDELDMHARRHGAPSAAVARGKRTGRVGGP
jgi:hypothetical protein